MSKQHKKNTSKLLSPTTFPFHLTYMTLYTPLCLTDHLPPAASCLAVSRCVSPSPYPASVAQSHLQKGLGCQLESPVPEVQEPGRQVEFGLDRFPPGHRLQARAGSVSEVRGQRSEGRVRGQQLEQSHIMSVSRSSKRVQRIAIKTSGLTY